MVTVSLNQVIFQESYKFFLLVPVATDKSYSVKEEILRLPLVSYSSSLFFLPIKLSNPKLLQTVTKSWILLAVSYL